MVPPEGARRCPDSECGAVAEPEQDGEHVYHECTVCGYQFGYHKLTPTLTANSGGSCAVGIPENVRRAASAAMENTLRGAGTLSPLLQIGRRHD